MKLSKSRYQINRAAVKAWFITKPDADLCKEASAIAMATGCPIIIIVEYMMEEFGRTQALIDKQNYLMKFYNAEVVA